MNFDSLFTEFNFKKVLVIGDAMIDAYTWGKINRNSPEASIPIVAVEKNENRLGGAANVALNIQSLGAIPILCSVIGNDIYGKIFLDLMKKANLNIKGILTSEDKKTTIKTRIIANKKHQLRIDEEDTKAITIEHRFLKLIEELIKDIDVVILQDYNKGVLTSKIITNVIKIANSRNIPSLADPKIKNFTTFKDCTIFKPNLTEINNGMKINLNADKTEEIIEQTKKLRNLLNVSAVLLTLSEKGICINSKDEFSITPAFKREMIDVSGAGDTVISVAALCLSINIDFKTMSILSSLAGGLVCQHVGVVPIDKERLIFEANKHIIS